MSTRAASAGAYTALGGVERAHGIPQRGSGEVTFRHTLASVGYTVRVLFMVLPYVMTFFALLVSGDLTSDWSHILFHPMGQFILVYALGHIVANVCFNFRMGTGLVRSVNALNTILCVAVSLLWFRLLVTLARTLKVSPTFRENIEHLIAAHVADFARSPGISVLILWKRLYRL